SPPWINIISSSAKSFTKPLKQLALQPSEPQSSCRQPHKNRPSGRQHVVVHASVRSLINKSVEGQAAFGHPDTRQSAAYHFGYAMVPYSSGTLVGRLKVRVECAKGSNA